MVTPFPSHSASPLSDELMRAILGQYRLPWDGFHGLAHWARVRETGLRLAPETGADPELIELFAVFHDACRHDEGSDSKHGKRGAELARRLRRQGFFDLDDERFDLLYLACRDHTKGQLDGDPTVRSCWDADRLDLGRVWVTVDPAKLCTETARRPEFVDWCDERARRGVVPEIVTERWLPIWGGDRGE